MGLIYGWFACIDNWGVVPKNAMEWFEGYYIFYGFSWSVGYMEWELDLTDMYMVPLWHNTPLSLMGLHFLCMVILVFLSLVNVSLLYDYVSLQVYVFGVGAHLWSKLLSQVPQVICCTYVISLLYEIVTVGGTAADIYLHPITF